MALTHRADNGMTHPEASGIVGFIDALVELGGCYRDGMRDKGGKLIVGPNEKMAERYYQMAAEKGSPDGMVCLAGELSSPQTLARLAGPAHRRAIPAGE